jgi:chromosome partitioning protein
MCTTVAFANQKGGVSKTTTAYALGAACAERGQRVLLVDLDPQASLTISAGLRLTPRDPTINAVMLEYIQDGEATLLVPAVRTLSPGLDLLPSIIDLASTAEGPLQSADRREFVLADLLQTLADAYDLVLIYCPPSLGILVINALTAAQEVIIPLVPEFLAAHGLQLLLDTIRRVRKKRLNPALLVRGMIFTMVDSRSAHPRMVMQEIRDSIGAQVSVLGEIKRSVRVAEAADAGLPITAYAANNDVSVAYRQIADALLTAWGLTSAATMTGAIEAVEVAHG